MDPDAIDRVVRKYAGTELGLLRDYSAHSMRATFVTTALENGAQLEDVQKLPATPIPAPPSSTTGAAIIRKRRRASSPYIEMTDTSAPGARITSPHY
jgi:hypothetical protein